MGTAREIAAEELIRKADAVKIIKNARAELVHDYAYAAADLMNPYIESMENTPTVCRSKILETFKNLTNPIHAAGACYCRECAKWHREVSDGCEYNWGQCNNVLDCYGNSVLTTGENSFCSYGEREQNEILD